MPTSEVGIQSRTTMAEFSALARIAKWIQRGHEDYGVPIATPCFAKTVYSGTKA
jgi:hypothetical protein